MYFDTHVHSSASPDSEMPPRDAIAALEKMGLGITFTEHIDFADGFTFDTSVYPAGYEKYRGEGVRIGLEIGLSPVCVKENTELVHSFGYDFIIGSVHNVDGAELYLASHGKLPNHEFAQRMNSGAPADVDYCIMRYLTVARELVENGGYFDSFGHIDYFARYLPKISERFFYANFPGEFDALLKAIAQRGIALEINTCMFAACATEASPQPFHAPEAGNSFLRNRKFAAEMFVICRRFAQLGGRLCTIGSDAHEIGELGRFFKEAREMAETCGLAIAHFKERKPVL